MDANLGGPQDGLYWIEQSPKIHSHPETKNVTLFGHSLCKYNQVKMRSCWIRVCPTSSDWCPPKEKHLDPEREQMEKQHEDKGKKLQQCNKEGFVPTVFRGTLALLTFRLTSGLQNCQRINTCCFKTLSFWSFVRSPRKPIHTRTQLNLHIHTHTLNSSVMPLESSSSPGSLTSLLLNLFHFSMAVS